MEEDKLITPQKAFEIPILKILEKLGGEAKPTRVYAELETIMKFTKTDCHKMQWGEIKWKNNAAWARQHMCSRGELDPSVRGRWKITSKGRQRLERELPSYDPSKYALVSLRSKERGVTEQFIKRRLSPPESITTDFLQKWGTKQGLNLFELGFEGVKKRYEEYYRENTAQVRGKYHLLRELLRKVPSEIEQVTLGFKEIENIVGDQLPKSARTYRPYWANTSSPNRLVKSIKDEGWEVEDVFIKESVVVLRKQNSAPISGMKEYLNYILEGSPRRPRPNPDVLAKWIHNCRQIGFYFQGKVLYEKGGLTPESLSNHEAVRVEEDYRVCLRKVHQLQKLK